MHGELGAVGDHRRTRGEGVQGRDLAPGCMVTDVLSRNGVFASGESSRLSPAPPSAVVVWTRISRGKDVPRDTASTLGAWCA